MDLALLALSVFPVRHVTYRARARWISVEEFRGMPLPQRIRYVRSNLVGTADDGGMTQPELSRALKIRRGDHHTIVRWERGYSEPKRYRLKLAALTPYDPDDFSRRTEAEALRAELAVVQARAVRLERLLEDRAEEQSQADVPERRQASGGS